MSLVIKSIHHASFIVQDLDESLAFYCDLLGLTIDTSRPEMRFSGAWLQVGEQQQIHLLVLPNPDSTTDRPEHGGRDRHVALVVNSVQQLADKLTQAKRDFTMSKSGRHALFVRDPDGNTLEFVEAT